MSNRKYRGPLTEAEILRIKDRYADGVHCADISAQFDVSIDTILRHVLSVPRPRFYASSTKRRPNRVKTST